MLNKARRRFRWEAVWALGLICGVPAFAEAQQTGLFPLRPIRRQRVPCPNEDPVYGQYRNQYYGYFPTCWHKFPEGWGCPSAEAPDAAKSFREMELQKPDRPGGDNGAQPPGMDDEPRAPLGGRSPAPDRGALPPLPRDESSPFNLDTPNATPRGNRPGAPPAIAPRSGGPQSNAPNRRPAPLVAILPAPSEPPPAGASEPLLPLPEPSEPPPLGSATADPASVPLPAPEGVLPPIESAPASVPGDTAPSASADPPAQAPRRKTLIGGLLGSLGLKRQ